MAYIRYWNHFDVRIEGLELTPAGLQIIVYFDNRKLPSVATNVEVWFPIEGNLWYLGNSPQGLSRFFLGSLHDLGDIFTPAPKMIRDYNVKPGTTLSSAFICLLNISQMEQMREIAEREGVVQIQVRLNFSCLNIAGGLGQKTMKLEPIFNFAVTKLQIGDWITTLSSTFAEIEQLPKSTPSVVLSDYVEAQKCLNIEAFKASVALSRRALQEALEDKGATKGVKLYSQIKELFDKKILDNTAFSLANGVRQFGNYGAHPSEDLLAGISPDDAKLALDVLRKILKSMYS